MSKQVLPRSWEKVLDAVDHALHHAMEGIRRREAILEAMPAESDADARAHEHDEIGSRIRGMADLRAKSVDCVKKHDKELTGHEEIMAELARRTEEHRQKLAAWQGRAIG